MDCVVEVDGSARHRCDLRWANRPVHDRHTHTHARAQCSQHTHTRLTTTQVSRYQKGKTNLDFTEARDSEWQWHKLGHVQVCTSLQTDNHASTPPLSFYGPDALPAAQPTVSKHHDNVYGAVIMTKVIARVHPVHMMNVD